MVNSCGRSMTLPITFIQCKEYPSPKAKPKNRLQLFRCCLLVSWIGTKPLGSESSQLLRHNDLPMRNFVPFSKYPDFYVNNRVRASRESVNKSRNPKASTRSLRVPSKGRIVASRDSPGLSGSVYGVSAGLGS